MGGGKSAYAHFRTADYFALFTFSRSKWCKKVIQNAQMSISCVISLATSFKILSNSFGTSLRQHLL